VPHLECECVPLGIDHFDHFYLNEFASFIEPVFGLDALNYAGFVLVEVIQRVTLSNIPAAAGYSHHCQKCHAATKSQNCRLSPQFADHTTSRYQRSFTITGVTMRSIRSSCN